MIRRAHFYWGNTTLPWLQYVSISSFVQHHPDWRTTLYRPFDQTAYDSGPCYFRAAENAGVQIEFVDPDVLTGTSLQGYDSTNAWIQASRSDALRLWLLHEHGGLWSDMDVIYFRSVLESSVDGGDVSLHWTGGEYVYIGIISANQGAEALKRLLTAQQEKSPAVQAPGGQSPFAAELWFNTFKRPSAVPGFKPMDPTDFYEKPFRVGCHWYGARTLWASIGPSTFETACADNLPLLSALRRAQG